MAENLELNIKTSTAPLKDLTAAIRKAKEQVAIAEIHFGKMSQEFTNSSNKLKGLQTNLTSLKNTVKEAGNSVKMSNFQLLEFGENLTVVSAGLSVAAAGFIKLAQSGAELTVLRENFKGTAKDIALFRTAVGGNETESSLIKMSNLATDLGLSIEQQAIFFDLAESAADKYGGTIEENFNGLIKSSDGLSKGLRAVGISVNQFNDEQAKLISLTGKSKDALSANELAQINYQTVLNLTGKTLQDVANKTQDVGDKMNSLNVFAKEMTENFGTGVAGAFEKVYNAAGKVSEGIFGITLTSERFVNVASELGNAVSLGIISPFLNVIDIITRSKEELNDFIDTWLWFGKNQIKDLVGLNDNGLATRGQGGILGMQQTPSIIPKSKGGNNTSKQVAEKIVTAVYDDLKDQMIYLFKGGSRSARDLFSKNVPIPFLPGTVGDNGINIYKPTTQIDKEGFGESASKTLEDTQTIYGVVSQTMSLIGIETNSFLGKLIGGFGTVLTIMESIKAVNTIFSFIPGLAAGGPTSGVNWVGEQGKELLFSPGSYVMNHSDSMRFVNQNSSGSNVNVYLSGNIDVQAALKKDNKKYRYVTIK